MKDQYDEQIERLTAQPRKISDEWIAGRGLFKMIRSNCLNMCPSMVRNVALHCTQEFKGVAAEIAKDERIPAFDGDITSAHLPIFAEWQRRIDREEAELKRGKEASV